jgi:hypothetical protein
VKTVYIPTPKPCDIPGCTTSAAFDNKTIDGPWANLCTEHHDTYAHPLFDGGYRLVVGPEPIVDEREQRAAITAAIESGDADLVWDLVGDGDLIDFL